MSNDTEIHLTDHQKISIMKLHGCGKGWTGENLRQKLLKLDLSPDIPDPFWEMLRISGKLSSEELRTGQHAPFHGWAKEFVEQQLQKMN